MPFTETCLIAKEEASSRKVLVTAEQKIKIPASQRHLHIFQQTSETEFMLELKKLKQLVV